MYTALCDDEPLAQGDIIRQVVFAYVPVSAPQLMAGATPPGKFPNSQSRVQTFGRPPNRYRTAPGMAFKLSRNQPGTAAMGTASG